MAYPSSRGHMISKLKSEKGIKKFDGVKIERISRQELIALYNKEFCQ